jgi:hypothetical protein
LHGIARVYIDSAGFSTHFNTYFHHIFHLDNECIR